MFDIPDNGIFHHSEQLIPRANPGSTKFTITDAQFTLATIFLISTMILQVIAIIVVFARTYTRGYPAWRFRIDDYLIVLAFAIMTAMFGVMYESHIWAWGGRHPTSRTLKEQRHVAKYGSISMPLWAWATGFVKISIAFMLLRFQQSQKWKYFMYVMIALNIVLIGFTGVWNMFQCIPFKAVYDPSVKDKKCFSKRMIRICLYVSAACNISTDLVFSFMPLTFLGKIRRPLREKVVIGGLMALGLIASAFSLAKVILAAKLETPQGKDLGAYLMLFGLLSILEVQASFIAACIPTLRGSTRRLLIRIGLLDPSRCSGYRWYGAGSSISGGPKGVREREMELNMGDSRGAMGSRRSGIEEIRALDEDGDYAIDTTTGRIICVPRPVHINRSNLVPINSNSEWGSEPCTAVKEEWELQNNTSLTR